MSTTTTPAEIQQAIRETASAQRAARTGARQGAAVPNPRSATAANLAQDSAQGAEVKNGIPPVDEPEDQQDPNVLDEDEPESPAPKEAEKVDEAPKDKPEEDKPEEEDKGDEEKKDEENKPVPAKAWQSVFRRERQARELEASSKAAIREAQAVRQQALEAQAKANAVLEHYERDPYDFVESRGKIDYDKWAQRRLAGGKPQPGDEVAQLRAEMQKMRAETEAKERQAQERMQTAQMESKVQTWLEGVPRTLADPKYKIIADFGAQDEVPALAGQMLKQTGKWLTQEEAADRILVELKGRLDVLRKAGHIEYPQQQAPRAPAPAPESRAATPPQAPYGHDEEELVVRGRKRSRPMTRTEEIQHLSKNLQWVKNE